MYILTLIRRPLNNLHNNILYGPQEIPRWHSLYGRKVWRCGWYERKLRLYDKRIITVIVYRFYSVEEKKTYSILPLFISHYERHINTVIEDVLRGYYTERLAAEKMAEEPSPSPWTIRRWLKKFSNLIDDLCYAVEKFLILNHAEYQPALNKLSLRSGKLELLLSKAELIEPSKDYLYLYGSLSYILYTAAVQNAEF
jgi:hypothetical protein